MADDEYDVDDAFTNEAEKICKVYDKDDFFTVVVQIVLAVLALGSLWFKRLQETPKRTFLTWFLDVAKQGVGACYAHVMNMVIAAVISNHIRGEQELSDQCAWYGLSYLIDTTLGLVLAIIFIKALDNIANDRNWDSLKNSGVYTGETAMRDFTHQSLAWVVILTIVKIIIYFFMVAASAPLAYFGGLLFKPFEGYIRVELVFVMIVFPGLMNVIYFWIADSYLKAKSDQHGAHEETPTAAGLQNKKESLLSDEEKKQSAQPSWTTLSTPTTNQGQVV